MIQSWFAMGVIALGWRRLSSRVLDSHLTCLLTHALISPRFIPFQKWLISRTMVW